MSDALLDREEGPPCIVHEVKPDLGLPYEWAPRHRFDPFEIRRLEIGNEAAMAESCENGKHRDRLATIVNRARVATSGIPADVLDLVRLSTPFTADCRDWAVRIHTIGLELRFQVDVDGKWLWDEIVGPCRVHVEQMNDNDYWIGFDGVGEHEGRRVCVDIGAKRAKVRMRGWSE